MCVCVLMFSSGDKMSLGFSLSNYSGGHGFNMHLLKPAVLKLFIPPPSSIYIVLQWRDQVMQNGSGLKRSPYSHLSVIPCLLIRTINKGAKPCWKWKCLFHTTYDREILVTFTSSTFVKDRDNKMQTKESNIYS